MTRDQDPAHLQVELRNRVELARDPYDKAVWQLLIGEADAGLATIRQGAARPDARDTGEPPPAQMALLADDPSAPALAAAVEQTRSSLNRPAGGRHPLEIHSATTNRSPRTVRRDRARQASGSG